MMQNTDNLILNHSRFLLEIACNAVELFVRSQQLLKPVVPRQLKDLRRGCFVSIYRRGQLRGCIGTVLPTQPNIVMEVVINAISSATRDPRFPPVTIYELPELQYKIDVLSELEKVTDPSKELDSRLYGVVVVAGSKRGVLLPDLPGIDSWQQQLEIARQKAGILPTEKAEIYRFSVIRIQ